LGTNMHKGCAYRYTGEKNYGWATFTYLQPRICKNVG
jgi:hypothetical protein